MHGTLSFEVVQIYGKYEALAPGKFRSYLQQTSELLCGQVQSMDQLLQSLLAFGKFPSPQLRPERPEKIFQEVARRYQSLVESKQLQLIFPATSLSVTLALDLGQIMHLMHNLVANALEANPHQMITMKFTHQVMGNALRVQIGNDGKIIPEHQVVKIFQPNFSSKIEDGGHRNSGLGLAIAKKVALDHGGDLILLANDAQQGVVFELELPIMQKQNPSELIHGQ